MNRCVILRRRMFWIAQTYEHMCDFRQKKGLSKITNLFISLPNSLTNLLLPFSKLAILSSKLILSMFIRAALSLISNIVRVSSVQFMLYSWQYLSLQFILDLLQTAFVLSKLGVKLEYLENWNKRSREFLKLFTDPSRNITISSAYCNMEYSVLPILMPFISTLFRNRITSISTQ